MIALSIIYLTKGLVLRKEREFFEFSPFAHNRDYKLEHVEQELQRNFESLDKWLYLGLII